MGLSPVLFEPGTSGSAASVVVSDNEAMQAGDQRFLVISISTRTVDDQSGWSAIDSDGDGDVYASTRRIYVFRREHLGDDEPASFTFTFSGTANHAAYQFAIRGADSSTPVDVATSANGASSGDMLIGNSITTQTDDAMLIFVGAKAANNPATTIPAPAGMDSVAFLVGTGSAGHGLRIASQMVRVAGATLNRTSLSNDAGNPWGAVLFAVRDALSVVRAAPSWGALRAISQERAPTLPGAECPNDGTRLRTASDGGLYCPFDGWRGPAEQAEANAGGRVTGYGVGYYGISPYGV